MNCKYCGKPLDPDSQFCKYCGEKRQIQPKRPAAKSSAKAQPKSVLSQMPKWTIPAACIAAMALLITGIVAVAVSHSANVPEIAETPDETIAITEPPTEQEQEPAAETQTEPEPTEADFETDAEWAQGYYNTLLEFEEDHPEVNAEKNIKYRLLYIDDNEIPELLLQTGDTTVLYTYYEEEVKRVYSSGNAKTEKLLGVRTRRGTFLTSRTTDSGERYAVNTLQNGKSTETEAYRSEDDEYTINGTAADFVSYTQYVRAKQAAYQLTDIPVYHKKELLTAMLAAADGEDIPEKAPDEELPELTTVDPDEEQDTTEEADDERGEKHFTVVAGNMTWSEAQAAAKAKGGHLAYIKSAEDYAAVKAAIAGTDLKYLWVGGKTTINSDGSVTAKWADGSSTSYLDSADLWFGHEPSGKDGDTPEPYMMLWNVNGWSFNDNSDACVKIYESGTMGYLLETYE